MTLRIPPVALAFLCAGVGWGLSLHSSTLQFSSPLGLIPGAALVSLGVIVLVICIGAFASAGTTVDPLHPELARSLVTRGPYRISRNPMYLAMALVLSGGAMILGNGAALLAPIAFVWLATVLHIKPEEAALKESFGEAFETYRQKTRRWV